MLNNSNLISWLVNFLNCENIKLPSSLSLELFIDIGHYFRYEVLYGMSPKIKHSTMPNLAKFDM